MVFKMNLSYKICFLLTKITILNDNRNSMFIFCVIYNNPFPLHLIIYIKETGPASKETGSVIIMLLLIISSQQLCLP